MNPEETASSLFDELKRCHMMIRRAQRLHQREETTTGVGSRRVVVGYACSTCYSGDPYVTAPEWPCPTARALGEEDSP